MDSPDYSSGRPQSLALLASPPGGGHPGSHHPGGHPPGEGGGGKQQLALRSLLAKQRSPGGGDTRLREALRDEKQRGAEAVRTCQALEQQVLALSARLRAADAQARTAVDLVDELAAARARADHLAKIVSEQDAKLLASAGQAAQRRSPQKVLAVASDTSATANQSAAAAWLRSAWFYASHLCLGLGLLVLVVALAFATLAAAAKVASAVGGRPSTYDARRTIY